MRSLSHNLRRLSTALLLSVAAAGCASFGGDMRAVVDYSQKIISPPRVSLVEAASSPYASLGVRVGGGAEVMIILASDTGKEQQWLSSARIGITTSAGRVVRTSGFGHDLGGLSQELRSKIGADTSTTHWLADFPDLKAFSVPIECKRNPAGNETIEILGTPIQTQRIEENCRAESRTFIWTFQNTYWTDLDNGMVWRSFQNVHPKLDQLELEVLRPPA